MPDSLQIRTKAQLLVEGQDDRRVFGKIAEDLGITDVQVHEYGGYPNLRRFLRTFVALPGFRRVMTLAVVADADLNNVDRSRGIRGTLGDVGLPVPDAPLQMASKGDLEVAYLVVPHGQNTGMIEDICLESVSDDPAMKCVDDYFQCIGKTSLTGPNPPRMSKARVHAFLASRQEPGLRLGYGILTQMCFRL